MHKFPIALLLLTPLSLFAQTGPGGVSSGTTNLLLWLDSRKVNDDGSNPNVGDEVVTWYDQSGNNVDVTRITPSVAAYSATGVTFDADGYLQGSDATFPTGTGARTAIVCASSPSTNTDDVLFFYGTANNNQSYGILKRGSGTATPNGIRNYFYGNDLDVANGFTPSGTLKIITTTYQPNTQSVYINNGTATSRNPGAINTTLGAMGLQIGGWDAFDLYSSATIAEVIFYDKVLNAAEIIIVNNYLAAKYGLTLAANDLYDNDNVANGNFDYDVAGIGRAGSAAQTNTSAQSSIVTIDVSSGSPDLENNEYYIWGHDNGGLVPTSSNIPAGIQARLTRIWRGSESGGDGITNFDVRFDLTGLGTVTVGDLRLLVDTDGDGSFTDGPAGTTVISGAISVGGNVYQFNDVTIMNNDDRFTLGTINTTTTPLPVELLTFELEDTKSALVLHWSTATETDNDFFEIEKSHDGFNWTSLGRVKGAGSSKELISYEFTDVLPFSGLNYYRLKQVDYDGDTEYSPVKSVSFTYDNPLFPNPTTGIVNLITKEDNTNLGDALIFNTVGQNITNQVKVIYLSRTQLQLDLSSLPRGIYYIKTSNSSYCVSKE